MPKYTVVQLRKICKEKGIKGYSKLKKAELLKHCLGEKPVSIKKEMPKTFKHLSDMNSGVFLNETDIVLGAI